MLRDKSLIPLSHQHQHVLALCVRIERASPIPGRDLEAWQSEIAQLFRGEISLHFAVEEQVLFPAARAFAELVPLVEELLADHAWLRETVAKAEGGRMSAAELSAFAHRFSAHIRKEERQLFEQLQGRMSPDELATLGKRLGEGLQDTDAACILPTQATRLRPKK